MMLVSEESKDNFIAFVITGNGRWEQVILKSIAKRYNGRDKVLYFPKSPFKHSRKTGLSCLDILRLEKEKLNIIKKCGKLLVLIDKEHISSVDDITKKLESLRVFEDFEMENNGDIVKIIGNLGNREIVIHIVIFGKEKCIEEDVSELIKLEFGENIYPDKNAIKDFLKSKGLKRKDLIEDAKIENLEIAFNPLIRVIKFLEGEKL
ncbi:hypothetical protein Metig_0728 [Methanotorris igneus Kol 5]|uniref:Uncharacterized protein n=2 Tax=Methanotorris igneus TaxID=2189 RepID=F6BCR7_METIK|nr:hypothetical protein Metig_0728 [Methanotorris igneus Kol 5]